MTALGEEVEESKIQSKILKGIIRDTWPAQSLIVPLLAPLPSLWSYQDMWVNIGEVL